MTRLTIRRLRARGRFAAWHVDVDESAARDDVARAVYDSFARRIKGIDASVQLNPDLSGAIFGHGDLQIARIEVS